MRIFHDIAAGYRAMDKTSRGAVWVAGAGVAALVVDIGALLYFGMLDAR